MHLYPINGAAGRLKSNSTPWGYRDATGSSVIVGIDPDPANKKRIIHWAKEYWSELHPYSAGGAYITFMMEEREERIRATYGKELPPCGEDQGALRPGKPVRRESEREAEVKEAASIKPLARAPI